MYTSAHEQAFEKHLNIFNINFIYSYRQDIILFENWYYNLKWKINNKLFKEKCNVPFQQQLLYCPEELACI